MKKQTYNLKDALVLYTDYAEKRNFYKPYLIEDIEAYYANDDDLSALFSETIVSNHFAYFLRDNNARVLDKNIHISVSKAYSISSKHPRSKQDMVRNIRPILRITKVID